MRILGLTRPFLHWQREGFYYRRDYPSAFLGVSRRFSAILGFAEKHRELPLLVESTFKLWQRRDDLWQLCSAKKRFACILAYILLSHFAYILLCKMYAKCESKIFKQNVQAPCNKETGGFLFCVFLVFFCFFGVFLVFFYKKNKQKKQTKKTNKKKQTKKHWKKPKKENKG